jgi:uncharacterized protein (TIGR02186 family)
MVTVRGGTDPDAQVLVVVTGDPIAEQFNRKGRLGPFWGSVGKVSVSGVPRLHLVASDQPASALLPRAVIEERLLDVEAVARRAKFDAPGADRAVIEREYVKLKQAGGVLGAFVGALRYDRTVTPTLFTASIAWPDAVAPGRYRVQVVHVRGGAVVADQEASLDVVYEGLPRLVAHVAFEQSLLFGIASVLVAVSVGFMMGLVFKRGAGGH